VVTPYEKGDGPEGRGPTAKKPYGKPELTIYGPIVRLTQNISNTGKTDNPAMKT
jgi:hypothetical protein